MIKRKKFDPRHLDGLEPTSVFFGENGINTKEHFMDHPHNFAHTLYTEDDLCLGAVGGTVLWAGVAEVWAIFSKHIYTCPVQFTKGVLSVIQDYEQALTLHRVQAYVLEGEAMAYRWATTLGFASEGLLKAFGEDRRNYNIMARVR